MTIDGDDVVIVLYAREAAHGDDGERETRSVSRRSMVETQYGRDAEGSGAGADGGVMELEFGVLEMGWICWFVHVAGFYVLVRYAIGCRDCSELAFVYVAYAAE